MGEELMTCVKKNLREEIIAQVTIYGTYIHPFIVYAFIKLS